MTKANLNNQKTAAESLCETIMGKSGTMDTADIKGVTTLTRGRGDPTSTMLWSPRKHASQKQPLELEEVEASKHEVELGDEADLGEELEAEVEMQEVKEKNSRDLEHDKGEHTVVGEGEEEGEEPGEDMRSEGELKGKAVTVGGRNPREGTEGDAEERLDATVGAHRE